MQKLIPTIYFYLLSAVGMVLIIVGLFNASHFIAGTFVYEKYPLRYGTEYERCEYRSELVGIDVKPQAAFSKEDCYKGLESERQQKKVEDIENALAFTLIGLFIFSLHFYFARKQKVV